MTTTAAVAAATNTASYSAAARQAAEAAGRAALAVAVAAENAEKPGKTSSEFKLQIGALLLAGALGALQTFSLVPGPWQLFALLGVGALGGVSAYTVSRGKTKSNAIVEASKLAIAESTKIPLLPAD